MAAFGFIDSTRDREEEEGQLRALSRVVALLDTFFLLLFVPPCFARPYPLLHDPCKVASPAFSLHISQYMNAGVPPIS